MAAWRRDPFQATCGPPGGNPQFRLKHDPTTLNQCKSPKNLPLFENALF
jgi:hypothetical protein